MGQIADTDAQYLGAMFPEIGIACYHRQTVGDNLSRLTEALKLALSRADIVVTIGGLGPTEDDLTREGIAAALDDPLIGDPAMEERLQKLFALRKIAWTERQLEQAKKPSCGDFIENPNGSAPGLVCRKNGKTVIAMPGPRFEFVPMADGPVREILAKMTGEAVLVSKTLKLVGMGESAVEETIRDLISGANPSIGVYAHPGEVHLRLTASASDRTAALALIAPLESEIRTRLAHAVYGSDAETLPSAVLDLLKSKQQTVVTVESCTGGMVCAALTAVPGSSTSVMGGVITYSNWFKQILVGVEEVMLAKHGAVSETVARQMAVQGRIRGQVDWSISITGIAGPDGGTPEKPVGLVFIGVAGAEGVTVEEFKFRGTREFVRLRSVAAALTMLWQALRSS